MSKSVSHHASPFLRKLIEARESAPLLDVLPKPYGEIARCSVRPASKEIQRTLLVSDKRGAPAPQIRFHRRADTLGLVGGAIGFEIAVANTDSPRGIANAAGRDTLEGTYYEVGVAKGAKVLSAGGARFAYEWFRHRGNRQKILDQIPLLRQASPEQAFSLQSFALLCGADIVFASGAPAQSGHQPTYYFANIAAMKTLELTTPRTIEAKRYEASQRY